MSWNWIGRFDGELQLGSSIFCAQNEPGELRACMKNHSVNAHQQVIWLRGISNAGGSRWVGKACGVDTSDEDKIFEDY